GERPKLLAAECFTVFNGKSPRGCKAVTMESSTLASRAEALAPARLPLPCYSDYPASAPRRSACPGSPLRSIGV
ncbi:MAG: hypothetical protein PHI96_05190, partial [Desulfovibrio sp.]|nr:hypothetical protein [Desulfovibrio sp.]